MVSAPVVRDSAPVDMSMMGGAVVNYAAERT